MGRFAFVGKICVLKLFSQPAPTYGSQPTSQHGEFYRVRQPSQPSQPSQPCQSWAAAGSTVDPMLLLEIDPVLGAFLLENPSDFNSKLSEAWRKLYGRDRKSTWLQPG